MKLLTVPETQNADIEFWKEFDRLAKVSVNEELLTADFPRVNLGWEIISFDGGEETL